MRMIKGLAIALGVIACGGTLASFSKGAHWLIRLWDFPRVQIAGAALAASVLHSLFSRGTVGGRLFVLSNVATFLWQCRKIYPFTPISSAQVKPSVPDAKREHSLRLLISNVMMENRHPDRLLREIEEHQPDLVLVVETDHCWAAALAPLRKCFPHTVEQPQENYYGLMLFSRLPLIDPRVEFLVQHDIPSVHTEVELPSGDRIVLHGLHPRPPEPIRDQDSTPRDAELVIVGRSIGENGDRPTVVAGDLNDVAWSPTTELFLRLSGLLDPRVGRGFYNSFNADSYIVRYPLDHVFHSNHFTLTELRRLPHIGSDHFPVLIELCYQPSAAPNQPKPTPDADDQKDAEEKIEKQHEAARHGDDRPARE